MSIKNDMQFGFCYSISPRKQLENYTAKHMPGKLQPARGRGSPIVEETFWTQGSGGALSATRTQNVRGPRASHWEEAVPFSIKQRHYSEISKQCPGGKMKSR